MTNIVDGYFIPQGPSSGVVPLEGPITSGGINVYYAIGAFTDVVGLPTAPFADLAAWQAFADALLSKTTAVSSVALNVTLSAAGLFAVGGTGNDVITFGLNILSGSAVMHGGAGDDSLTGGKQPDQLFGGVGNDTLLGNDAADTLGGGDGDDLMIGGEGTDLLTGGLGRDLMAGGFGMDRFDFDAVEEIGKKPGTRDKITDFETGLDKIDLSTIDARSKPGDQAFKFIKKGDFTEKAGQLHFVKIDKPGTENDVTRVEGDTNGNGKADFKLELDGLLKLHATDFVL